MVPSPHAASRHSYCRSGHLDWRRSPELLAFVATTQFSRDRRHYDPRNCRALTYATRVDDAIAALVTVMFTIVAIGLSHAHR